MSRSCTPRTIQVAVYTQLQKSSLRHNISDKETTCNEAFMWYTEHWYDIDLDSMEDHEKHFLNELIFEFCSVLPFVNPRDAERIGDPIISV